MVLDYSKWDALELSDDSDIEVHPNVDKRSFIQAKQNQIHQQRVQRRYEIDTLKYERVINDGLLARIDKLLAILREHEGSRTPEEYVFQVLMESAANPAEDSPPQPPEGVHTQVKEQPKYSQMMSSLVDQVKQEIGDVATEELTKAYIKGVQGHKDKVQGLQKELLERLAQLEKEEASKITSDQLHTGFDTSHVAKVEAEKNKAAQSESVELLNPSAGSQASSQKPSGDDDEEDPENMKASDLAKKFAKISRTDYRALQQFIGENPQIVAEKETDGLLVEAFNSQMAGKEDFARQCVHQGLLLQYCRSLGRDGISLFFKRYALILHLSPFEWRLTQPIVSPPRTTKPPPFSRKTSPKPTTESRLAPQSSRRTVPPRTTLPEWSKSSCTPWIPTPRSPSTSLPPTAGNRSRSKPVRSLTLSRRTCRRRWPRNPWMRSTRCLER